MIREAPARFFEAALPSPVAIRQVVLRAAESVFADMYTDPSACDAIDAALPALRSNPREIKS